MKSAFVIRFLFLVTLFTTTRATADENPLALPPVGAATLRVVSPTILELQLITSKPSSSSPLTNWNFLTWTQGIGEENDGDYTATNLPSAQTFTVLVNGQPNAVQKVSFRRRVLYAWEKQRDLRIGNALILTLSTAIPDGASVSVQTSDASLWSPPTVFAAVKSPDRWSPAVHVNQEGYMPNYPKKAFVGHYLGDAGEMTVPQLTFQLVNTANNTVAHNGSLVQRVDIGWVYSDPPYTKVYEADFTSFNTPGRYVLRVPQLGQSLPFLIHDSIAAGFTRAYALGLYHQRCGHNNVFPYSRFLHGVCHAQPASIPTMANSHVNQVLAAETAEYWRDPLHTAPQLKDVASSLYPIQKTGSIDVSRGHHDAGDYSKYTINSAALIHALVFAVDAFPGVISLDNLGLPESGDGTNDLLQEAKWEADFLLKMQDNDGGFFFLVYPKERRYENDVLPDAGDPQVVFPKTTAVTAASVGALAEIASSPAFKARYPTEAINYFRAASNGWRFISQATNQHGINGSYQKITHYGNEFRHNDEIAWAAAAMFAATGNSGYHQALLNWLPNPNTNSVRRWDWVKMFEGYGCAIRTYAFAARTGRVPAGSLNAAYLLKCENEIRGAADDQARFAEQTSYNTSFPDPSKDFATAGWYLSGDPNFDLAVGYQIQSNAAEKQRYVAAIIGNMNYEGGGNPVNIAYLTGIGWMRQREIVHQYARNDRRVLPPSGIPLGMIQGGFQRDLYHYHRELYELSYPRDGRNLTRNPYPFCHRWADTWNTTTEFVHPQQGRGLAAYAFLMATNSTYRQQVWNSANAAINLPAKAPITNTLAASVSSSIDLTGALTVWEVLDEDPVAADILEFQPTKLGEYWVEAEAALPDGRRVVAENKFLAYDPLNGGDPLSNDSDTIALFHFDTDFKDVLNRYTLTKTGNAMITNATGWMRDPAGGVVRFNDVGDSLSVAIPDSAMMPGPSANPITIEARIFIRGFKAWNRANAGVVFLDQQYDSFLGLYDPMYPDSNDIIGVKVRGVGTNVVKASQWEANVSKYTWHSLVITLDASGVATCHVDGVELGRASAPCNVTAGGAWTLTLGNFDGDIDEVRISKVTRPVVGRSTLTVAATDANAAEPGTDQGQFRITRSGGSTTVALGVYYEMSGAAQNGSDFNLPGWAVIPAGSSFVNIALIPLNDAFIEPSEQAVLTILPNAAYGIGSASQATIAIADDDTSTSGPTVTVTATDPNAAEAGSDPGVFTVSRSGGSTASSLLVNYSVGGTAANGTDYSTISGSVTIPANATSANVTITPINDSVAEGNESVVLTLSSTLNYNVGSPSSATVTIVDDDKPTVTITATDASAGEAGGNSGQFTVTRTGSTSGFLDVYLSLSGTATSGSDYNAISSPARIPSGSASVTIAVNPVNDSVVEGNETVIAFVAANAAYTVGSPSSATVTIADDDSGGTAFANYVSSNTTRQGNWKNYFGTQGYTVIQNATNLPSGVTVTPANHSVWTWAANSTEVRCLEKAIGTDRIAAVWFSSTEFTVTIAVPATQTKRVSLYFLDWDNANRQQTVYLMNGATQLDARTVTGFSQGKYLTWDISGTITFRIVNNSATANAVVSGIFFDPAADIFIAEDWTTEGAWRSAYGADGYNVIGDATSYPSYATVSASGNTYHLWQSAPTDPGSLQRASNPSQRIAATWYNATQMTIDVNVSGTTPKKVAMYFHDWDGLGREQTVTVENPSTGQVLDSHVLTDFEGGVYLSWNLLGSYRIRIANNLATLNAVVNGIFFGPAAGSIATFIGLDTATQGTWRPSGGLVYGQDGYNVIGNTVNYPSYATVTPGTKVDYTWNYGTSDVRALQKAPPGTDRISSVWHSPTGTSEFSVNLNVTGTSTKRVALYLLDWDGTDINRRTERVEIYDTATMALLDSRTLSDFRQGAWLVWNIKGQVTLKFVKVAGNNAILNGIFFGQ